MEQRSPEDTDRFTRDQALGARRGRHLPDRRKKRHSGPNPQRVALPNAEATRLRWQRWDPARGGPCPSAAAAAASSMIERDRNIHLTDAF
jgi:hypothetical protein